MPHATAQRHVRDRIADQACDVDLRTSIDQHTHHIARVRHIFADLSRLNSAHAERVGVIRQVREVVAGRVAGYISKDCPIRIRPARLFDLKAGLATDWCPVQSERAVEIDVTTLRISEVAGNRLR